MKSKQPTKNRINMHDIVAQPLGALPGAVDAILQRPEELDDVEVQSIFDEVSFIILRAEEALASRDADAFCALFKLFSEGFARSEASFAKGVDTFRANGALLQTLRDLFRGAVEQCAFPLQSPAVVELVQVISSLCDGDSIKESCGSLFMEDLANMIDDIYRDPEEARGGFIAQRAAATALINIVKGSRQNKQRIASWKFLADSCALSVDVFFQLQCVELLFRVSRQNKAILAHLGSRLRPSVVDKIRLLPNDESLLVKMIELLNDINEGRTDVLAFQVERVDAAHSIISEKTVAYFTANYLVVLVTSANADNVTIPYSGIRSVALGKDGRVIFRLDEFPTKLEVLLSRTPGEDTVTLFLSVENLPAFKQSPIRTWIVAKKESQRLHRGGKRNSSSVGAVGGGEGAAIPLGRQGQTRKRRSESPQNSLSPNSGHDGCSTATSRVVAALQKMMMKTSEEGVDGMLAKMRQLVESKADSRRGEAAAILSESMEGIQRLVDEARAKTDGCRDALREAVEGSVQSIESSLDVAQSRVAVVVDKLNAALQGLRDSNTAVHEQMACIEIELQQSLEISRDEEARDVRALRSKGEEYSARLEAMLDHKLIERSDPVKVVSEYLHSGRRVS